MRLQWMTTDIRGRRSAPGSAGGFGGPRAGAGGLAGLWLLISVLCAAAGCTPAKARALRVAATQFEVEAAAAIDAVAMAMDAELAPPPRGQAEADRQFVEMMLGLPAGEPIDSDLLELAIDPYTVELEAETAARRQRIAALRVHYTRFAEALADLERGHLFAAEAVKRSGPVAARLTAQMVHFAQVWSQQPPRLLQHRTALLTAFEDVLADESAEGGTDEAKRQRLLELKERWLAVGAEEEAIRRRAVEQCLRAAAVGRQVSRAIEQYDKLSLDDIVFYLNLGLRQAGALSGRDLSGLRAETEKIVRLIREDEALSDLSAMLLEAANEARGAAGAEEDGNESEGSEMRDAGPGS